MAQIAGKFTLPRMFDPRRARDASTVPYLLAHCTWVYPAPMGFSRISSLHTAGSNFTWSFAVTCSLLRIYIRQPLICFYRYLALSLSAMVFFCFMYRNSLDKLHSYTRTLVIVFTTYSISTAIQCIPTQYLTFTGWSEWNGKNLDPPLGYYSLP